MLTFFCTQLTLTLLSTLNVNAQVLTRKEKKAIKKEIKSYKKDPVKWVNMKDRHEDEVENLKATIEMLKAKLEAETKEKQELAEKLAALEAQYRSLKKSIPSTQLPEGTVYQVQMGYYEYLDLISFNEKLKTIKAEEVDGAKRYVIGYFPNMMDALQFSNDIKKLGISDAFVSQYIDGERNIEFDILEEIEK